MSEYHRIPNVYARDPVSHEMTTQCSTDEIEYLFDNEWIFTEKIDGMNIRVVVGDCREAQFLGRTDRAIIPPALLAVLSEKFTTEKLRETFSAWLGQIVLYGEGYGRKIQKGGGLYIPDGVDFILFDVRVGRWWLQRDMVREIADTLDIGVVPEVGCGTLQKAIDIVRSGFPSWVSKLPLLAEGLVCRPAVELAGRNGSRVICKVKTRDFGGKT